MMANSKQSNREGIPILMSGAFNLEFGATSLRSLAGSQDAVISEMSNYWIYVRLCFAIHSSEPLHFGFETMTGPLLDKIV